MDALFCSFPKDASVWGIDLSLRSLNSFPPLSWARQSHSSYLSLGFLFPAFPSTLIISTSLRKFPTCSCVLSTFSSRTFDILSIVILNYLILPLSKPSESDSAACFACQQWGFSPCLFVCLILFDSMPDLAVRTVEVEVNSVLSGVELSLVLLCTSSEVWLVEGFFTVPVPPPAFGLP